MVSASRLRRSWIVFECFPVRHFPDLSRSNELLIGGNVPMAHFTASVLYLLPSTHQVRRYLQRACWDLSLFPIFCASCCVSPFMVWYSLIFVSALFGVPLRKGIGSFSRGTRPVPPRPNSNQTVLHFLLSK